MFCMMLHRYWKKGVAEYGKKFYAHYKINSGNLMKEVSQCSVPPILAFILETISQTFFNRDDVKLDV